MSKTTLYVKKYFEEGDLAHEYQPFRNKIVDGQLQYFETDKLDFNLNKPLSIECQPSYDGTVNLIINDDLNPPRIINSTYSVIEDNRYKRIVRNQLIQTNLYKEEDLDLTTRLFRNIKTIPKINLLNIISHGQLSVGNYTFYFKLADNDYNQTDIVAESGIISIPKGTITDSKTISGELVDERTEKSIYLELSNLDTSFANVFVYYRRDTSDVNGVHTSKTYKIVKPYKIKSSLLSINIDGYELVEEINEEELNIQYNICTGVKTQAQVQNMLFFGNVQQTLVNNKELQNLSYFIQVQCVQDYKLGYIDPEDYRLRNSNSVLSNEYYNPLNIYYYLGYWPKEIYRFGVVYIFNDDSLSPVYNLRGCRFERIKQDNFEYIPDNRWIDNESYIDAEGNKKSGKRSGSYYTLYSSEDKTELNYIPKEETFLATDELLANVKGVFQLPNANIINDRKSSKEESTIEPIGLKFTINNEILSVLKNEHKVKGFFFVRQKRIPTTLAQGFSIGVDISSYIPMIYDNNKKEYTAESFINKSRILTTGASTRVLTTGSKQSSGLLCLDASVNKQLQSILDNSEFVLTESFKTELKLSSRHYYVDTITYDQASSGNVISKLIFIPPDTPLKYTEGNGYCTRAGTPEDVKDFKFFAEKDFLENNNKLLRGTYCPFVGTNTILKDNRVYNIKISGYNEAYLNKYFEIRGDDYSPFMAISQRYEIYDREFESVRKAVNGKYSEEMIIPTVYRGDCFTNTVTIRINTNFIDPEVPVNEIIVQPTTWKDGYKGYDKTSAQEWKDINRADVNSVPMGYWLTYKCLSNYHLDFRSENRQNVEEMAQMGNPRSFYPLQGISTAPSNKIEESWILNDGYNVTLPFKKYFTAPDVPYTKELFDTRIMFSDVQQDDSFKNAYRIFQGLDYKDVERQYGAIVKLLPLGTNLFCVFEHGVAIIPINEKALLSTTTGQAIHMYGAGVLQNQVTAISPDYGSIWQESVVRTPNAIYGVDTYAKKIWKYNQREGFVLISDFAVQRFLNDNISLSELDKYPTIAYRNVKTHYNNYKGDVMFTFYNKDKIWNLCYNERLQKWITKYSWTPLYSENINNIFYTMDRDRAAIMGIVYENQNSVYGIHIQDREKPTYWPNDIANVNNLEFLPCGNLWDYTPTFERILTYEGFNLYDYFFCRILSVSTILLDESGNKIHFKWDSVYDDVGEGSSYKSSLFSSDSENPVEIMRIEPVLDSTGNKTNKSKLSLFNTESFSWNDYYYITIDVEFIPHMIVKDYEVESNWNNAVVGQAMSDTLALVRDINDFSLDKENTPIPATVNKVSYDNLLRNGFYVHGRAGIFDEISYFDQKTTNQITPTKWYDQQEPFEFEFVVNTPQGIQKIFNNLVIISNNVEPDSLEISLIGDVYDFNKEGIFKKSQVKMTYGDNGEPNTDLYNRNLYTAEFGGSKKSTKFPDFNRTINLANKDIIQKYEVSVDYDPILSQYKLCVSDNCLNIKDVGRRLGNIEYKEDKWNYTISPIYFKNRYVVNSDQETPIINESAINSTRIRDKWVKIKIKYTGDKLVVINAIQTLMTISYA